MVFKWNSFDGLIDLLEFENETRLLNCSLSVKKEKLEICLNLFYWFVLSFVKEKL